jgi:hypothetical protein
MAYTEPLGDVWKYNPDYNRAADFLGIDRHQREDVKLAQKISFLVDWAVSTRKSSKPEDALWTLNDLRKKLGVNSQGETLVGQLFEFVRLKQDRERKAPEVPYEQVINEMIQAKREANLEKEELDFRSLEKKMDRQIEKEQVKSTKLAEKTVVDYRKSFKPEPKTNIKIQAPIDHTPIVQPL